MLPPCAHGNLEKRAEIHPKRKILPDRIRTIYLGSGGGFYDGTSLELPKELGRSGCYTVLGVVLFSLPGFAASCRENFTGTTEAWTRRAARRSPWWSDSARFSDPLSYRPSCGFFCFSGELAAVQKPFISRRPTTCGIARPDKAVAPFTAVGRPRNREGTASLSGIPQGRASYSLQQASQAEHCDIGRACQTRESRSAPGGEIWKLITIVHPQSFSRWLEEEITSRRLKNAGRPRKPEEIRRLILQMANESG